MIDFDEVRVAAFGGRSFGDELTVFRQHGDFRTIDGLTFADALDEHFAGAVGILLHEQAEIRDENEATL